MVEESGEKMRVGNARREYNAKKEERWLREVEERVESFYEACESAL